MCSHRVQVEFHRTDEGALAYCTSVYDADSESAVLADDEPAADEDFDDAAAAPRDNRRPGEDEANDDYHALLQRAALVDEAAGEIGLSRGFTRAGKI